MDGRWNSPQSRGFAQRFNSTLRMLFLYSKPLRVSMAVSTSSRHLYLTKAKLSSVPILGLEKEVMLSASGMYLCENNVMQTLQWKMRLISPICPQISWRSESHVFLGKLVRRTTPPQSTKRGEMKSQYCPLMMCCQ